MGTDTLILGFHGIDTDTLVLGFLLGILTTLAYYFIRDKVCGRD